MPKILGNDGEHKTGVQIITFLKYIVMLCYIVHLEEIDHRIRNSSF